MQHAPNLFSDACSTFLNVFMLWCFDDQSYMKDIQFLSLVLINVAENQLYIVGCLLIAVFLAKSLTLD